MPVVQLVLHVPSSGRYPVSCLAAGLFEQANTFYVHAAIHSLTHVIDSQQADTCSAECFHFDTGTTETLAAGRAMHDAGRHINLEVDRDTGQRDRVAQGNQL